MSNKGLKRDFESARVWHVHFKSRLRSFPFGNGGEETALRDPSACSLSRWIAARAPGAGTYASRPDAQLFDRKHQLVPQESGRLLDLFLAWHLDEAIAGFGLVQKLADEMVALLITMEEKMRTRP